MSPAYSYFEQAKHLIVERARNLAKEFIENRGHDRPPFLAESYARLLGIQDFVKADLKETSAMLLKFRDSYLIKVNEKHHPVRQNFSIAHEIGHILFSELRLQSHTGNIEYRTYNPRATERLREKATERLCDVAATELLMPESIFRKYLTSFGVTINSIERLANIFRISVQAAAIRIAEVSTEPCLILLWQPWPKNKPKGFRLIRCVGPGGKTRGMPLHTLVKYPSNLHKAYECDSSIKSTKLFRVDTTTKRLPMESKGFGRGENRYVVSLAFLDR